jgi:hypothetical protein
VGQDPGEVSQRVDVGVLDIAFAGFDAESLHRLLHAAGTAWTMRERLPSIAVLWWSALRWPPKGRDIAGVGSLPALLDAARRACPTLEQLEGWYPFVPTDGVRYDLDGVRLRVDPGFVERPLAVLRAVHDMGRVVDPSLVARHGFGLRDLAEVALRFMDDAINALTLPGADAGKIDPTVLTDAAVRGVAGWATECEGVTSRCRSSERASAALFWATVSVEDLTLDLEPSRPLFGPALAVWLGEQLVPVPAGLLLEGLGAAANLLAREVTADSAAREGFRLLTEVRAYELLRGAGSPAEASPADANPGIVSSGLIARGRRHVVVFEVASAWDPDDVEAIFRTVADRLTTSTLGDLFGAEAVNETVAPDADVTALIVYGSPLLLVFPRRPGVVPVHLEELRMLLLMARKQPEGANLVWDFLADVSRAEDLPPLGLEQLFQWWLPLGAFEVAGLSAPVMPFADDPEWLSAAELAPTDELLAAAALPHSSWWDLVHGVGDTVVELASIAHRALYFVAPTARFIVWTTVPEGEIAPGVDRAIGLSLAKSIVDAVSELAVQPRRADGLPIVLGIGVVPVLENAAGEGEVGVEVGLGDPPVRHVGFTFDLRFFRYVAEDPLGAHAFIGRLLVEARKYCDESPTNEEAPTEEDRRDVDFLAAWADHDPVAQVGVAVEAIPIADAPPDTLPSGRAIRARALNAAAAGVRDAGIEARTYRGAEVMTLCRDQLYPALLKVLRERLATYDGEGAFATLADLVNRVYADRMRQSARKRFELTTPWRDRAFDDSVAAPDPSIRTWPLDMLVELLVLEPPKGSATLDAIDVGELAELAARTQAVGYPIVGQDLNPVVLRVASSGAVFIDADNDQQPLIDVPAYLTTRRLHETRLTLQSAEAVDKELDLDLLGADRKETEFSPLTGSEAPARFLAADDAMRDALGTGLDGIRAVTDVALDLTGSAGSVATVSAAELEWEAHTWSRVPVVEVRAAIGLLTLTRRGLTETGSRYWEKRARSQRLATKPFVEFGDRLWVMPYQVMYNRALFVSYLSEGRFPWPGSDVPVRVANAMNRYRQKLTQQLEEEAATRVRAAGLPFLADVQQDFAMCMGVEIPGQIDLLVLDEVGRRLLVLEVKDTASDHTPREVKGAVQTFYGSRGYVRKLLDKAGAIERAGLAAARLVKANASPGPYEVLPMMVTRLVEAAAFVREPSILFVVVDDLAVALASDALGTGHFPVQRPF